jgi:hypothetical protein
MTVAANPELQVLRNPYCSGFRSMAVDTTGKQQQTRKVRGIACYARDKPAPHTARRTPQVWNQ